MQFLRLFLFFLLISTVSKAQVPPKPKQPRILILLDGSSSMLQSWGNDGKQRFNAAGSVISKLIDSMYSVNDQVEFALRVYGHQSPAQENNCLDTRTEVRFSKDNLAQMQLRLASLHANGVSPIAYSIKQAAEIDMSDPNNNAYSLILITDGGESCGGDICEIARQLLEKKISFKPYILSLVDYAPLKQQYDCLGEYMLVSKEGDIPPVVGKIVESYKNMFLLEKLDRKLLETAMVSSPSALKVKSPTFKVSTGTEPEAPKPQPKPEPPPLPPLPKADIATLRTSFTQRMFPQMYVTPSFRTIKVPVFKVPVPEKDPVLTVTVTPTPPVPVPVPVTTPAANGPSKLVIPNTNKTTTPQPKTAVTTPKPAPALQPAKPKEAKYTVQREDAKETTLEVYFTNGKGKFFSTTPQVLLLDPKSGKQVHKFFRTVNASGNPDPQKQLTPGTYNLTVANKSNLLIKNIEIKENAKNKVMVQVGNASLIFTYEDNPKRPVSEYVAVVNRRFEPGPVIRQKCTIELEYEPGNYYIEINTLPVFKRNLDLDFDYMYDLQIPEDGVVNFTNAGKVGKVSLYTPLGDKFLKFHTIEVPGSTEGQKLVLQPGAYEAHFIKNPNLPNQPETVRRFFVKSNMITDLELE